MTRVLALAVLAALCPAASAAQTTARYVYFAPGNQTTDPPVKSQLYEVGAGADRPLDGGLAIRTDVAALFYFNGDNKRTIGGIGSFNVAYHPLAHRKVDPFIGAGYSLQFRDYTTNMANVSAGLHYWFRDNRGLLVEYRYHTAKDQPPIRRYWDVRIGLVFR